MAMKKTAAKSAPKKSQKKVDIEQPHELVFDVVLRGTQELIVDRFSDDAIEGLERAQGVLEKLQGGKKPKDPERCFEQSKYRDPDGVEALPAAMLQRCIRDAAVCIDDLPKAVVGRSCRVLSEWCPLEAKECYMRRDVGRNSGPGKSPDLRYRAAYRGWEVHLVVSIIEQHITPATLRALLMWAGHCIGLGNWRPSAPFNPGNKGTFEIKSLKLAKAAA